MLSVLTLSKVASASHTANEAMSSQINTVDIKSVADMLINL